jgi:hypothetical protein
VLGKQLMAGIMEAAYESSLSIMKAAYISIMKAA